MQKVESGFVSCVDGQGFDTIIPVSDEHIGHRMTNNFINIRKFKTSPIANFNKRYTCTYNLYIIHG